MSLKTKLTDTFVAVADAINGVKASVTTLAGRVTTIENNPPAQPTAQETKTAYESNANTNAFTDANKTTITNLGDVTHDFLADFTAALDA